MNDIGGYFELELPETKQVTLPPGVTVNSGRHALEYILLSLAGTIKHLFLPYYTCDVVLEPIRRLDIPYEFYHINDNFEIADRIMLNDGDYIIVNNYFGLKDRYIDKLSKIYNDKLIIDNAQAWYHQPDAETNFFYSPRKFFGLPDGGIAYTAKPQRDLILPEGFSSFRFSHLLKRIDEGPNAGYPDFKKNSLTLKSEPLTQMSRLTKRLLSTIDFERAKKIRRQNFTYLHKELGASNLLDLPQIDDFECPMVYPYMTHKGSLRQELIHNRIYVATYWPNVVEICQDHSVEYKFATDLIPIPIDQRYNTKHLTRITNIIKNANND